ncbi:MAG: methionine gamma-lyase family protein [Oscillospiraceae bacterium]|nr:methionine gamma-lyase family protein [Oscillospiraceae bacterium]
MGFDEICNTAELNALSLFREIDKTAYQNTQKVWSAFHKNRVSDSHFAGTTGYGYDDAGREALDKVMAEIMGCEDAIVRVQFVSGTHAIACALKAASPNGEGYLSVIGDPYDTLRGILPYTAVLPTKMGEVDFPAVREAILREEPPAVLIQRSRGYSNRKSLSADTIGELVRLIKSCDPSIVAVVDNCYAEFTEIAEPGTSGADLVAGSLIKNPGGGLAVTGGYIAGKQELVTKAADHLTAPGIGRGVGSSLGQNRLLFQGLFTAPHVVAQALKTAIFCAGVMEQMGFSVSPLPCEDRVDITQMISFETREQLLSFVRGIQKGSPVDSFVRPEPWAMPGYHDEVIMAAGTFIQGASIELSCDAPIREPFCAYMQGGLTYEAGKLGVMTAVAEILGWDKIQARGEKNEK